MVEQPEVSFYGLDPGVMWVTWVVLSVFGSSRIDVCRALYVSCVSFILATCPKKLRHLVWMSDSRLGVIL